MATLTTVNPLGIGYETGYFSGPQGEALAQHFFNAAFASRINANKIYKEAYHCNLVDECTMATWLDEFMGFETDCFPDYTLLETYGQYNLIKVGANVTVPVYPGTASLHLAANSHFVGGQFVLPQPGNNIVTPGGNLIVVTAVNLASAGDSILTVQLRDKTGNTPAQVLVANDELMVIAGAEIADCACPTGQFRANDAPIEYDVSMYTFGDKGSVCGDAVNKCQWLKIPFTDECGNVIEHWYTEALQQMYRDHEKAKYIETLFNPQWGLVPVLRARGMKFTPSSTTAITVQDIRDLKKQMDAAGISCREYAIFAGNTLFSQFQAMLQAAGVVKLDNTVFQPNMDCRWLNMDYCGIKVEGLTLHVYEECSFSNGKMLGSGSSIFPASAIFVPMCKRPACRRSTNRGDGGGGDNKMMSRVYFRSNDGRVWDNLTDSNGIFGPRNSFGAGCEQHDWTVKSRFLNEVHCANQWIFMGL